MIRFVDRKLKFLGCGLALQRKAISIWLVVKIDKQCTGHIWNTSLRIKIYNEFIFAFKQQV